MEKIKVLIADDDNRIVYAIESILSQNFTSIEVVAQTNSVENTIKALYEKRPHVAILDIHLIGGTAIEVVKNTSDLDFKVIFMSAYQEYALDDIQFSSIDFIYKPLDISELLVVVDQVLSSLVEQGYKKKMQTFFKNTDQKRESKQIVFKTRSAIISVPIADIICGESIYGGSRFYFHSQKAIEINQPLRRYESMLQSYMFYRCHTHYVINMRRIRDLDSSLQNVIMSNGQLIPVEFRRLETLKDQLRSVGPETSVFASAFKN